MDFVNEFRKLVLSQPVYNLRSVHNDNCPYVHMITFSRNSYLCFCGYKCEDSGYCFYPNELKDCYDTYFATQCELCYECTSCSGCYNCDFCNECVNCSDSQFCYDCKGCKHCFGCVGLRQKEYYIFNEPYTKEEYFKKLKTIDLKNPAARHDIDERVEALNLKHPHIYSVQLQTENCTGNNILRSKNCQWAFGVTDSEDVSYAFQVLDHSRDCYDVELHAAAELSYECSVGYNIYNCNFTLECGDLKDSEYCVRVFNSDHCFGCVSRSHASYEILNKKYPKEEWFKRVTEIKADLRDSKQYTNFLPDVMSVEW
ncbi:MAG: hypothetical protein AAB592_03955 [Patescibacteria group bacterium]